MTKTKNREFFVWRVTVTLKSYTERNAIGFFNNGFFLSQVYVFYIFLKDYQKTQILCQNILSSCFVANKNLIQGIKATRLLRHAHKIKWLCLRVYLGKNEIETKIFDERWRFIPIIISHDVKQLAVYFIAKISN